MLAARGQTGPKPAPAHPPLTVKPTVAAAREGRASRPRPSPPAAGQVRGTTAVTQGQRPPTSGREHPGNGVQAGPGFVRGVGALTSGWKGTTRTSPTATASDLLAPLPRPSLPRVTANATNGRAELPRVGGEKEGWDGEQPMSSENVSRRRSRRGPSPVGRSAGRSPGGRVSHPGGRCRTDSFSSQVTPGRAAPGAVGTCPGPVRCRER